MKKTALVLVGSAVLISAWVGCGGSDGTSSLIGNGDGGGGGDGSTANADSGSTPPTDSGAQTDSGAADSGAPKDAGNTTNYDGGGPGGNTTSVPCGNVFCTISTQVCCVESLNNVTTYSCATGTTCPVPDAGGGNPPDVTALKCTGQANCAAGSICCVSQAAGMGGGGNVATSSCVVGTTCGMNSAQLCDPGATPTGCAVDAGANSTCSSANIGDWGLKPPFATCGGKGN